MKLIRIDDPTALRPGPVDAKLLSDDEIVELAQRPRKRGPRRKLHQAYLEPEEVVMFQRAAERLTAIHDELALDGPTRTEVMNWIARRGMRDILADD